MLGGGGKGGGKDEKKDVSNAPAVLVGIVPGKADDRVAYLKALRVIPSLRKRGIASALIVAFARVAEERGVRRIELDDMSDRFRMEGNVYVRNGFVYRGKTGPEMYASPKAVLQAAKRERERAETGNTRELSQGDGEAA